MFFQKQSGQFLRRQYPQGILVVPCRGHFKETAFRSQEIEMVSLLLAAPYILRHVLLI